MEGSWAENGLPHFSHRVGKKDRRSRSSSSDEKEKKKAKKKKADSSSDSDQQSTPSPKNVKPKLQPRKGTAGTPQGGVMILPQYNPEPKPDFSVQDLQPYMPILKP